MNSSLRRDPLVGTKPSFMPAPGDPVDPVRREQDLRTILDQPRPTKAHQPDLRRRLQAVTVAAVGVLVAAVVVATNTQSGVDSRTSARQVLLAAAEATAKTDAPAPGRYWYLRTRSEGVEMMWPGRGHDEYNVVTESGSEHWTSRTGADRSVSIDGIDLTTRPLTERDRTEWDKAGNPVGIPDASPAPGAPPPPPMPTSMPASAIWQTGELKFSIGEASMPLSEVLTLPTDPAELKDLLLHRYRTKSFSGGSPTDEADWLTWEAVSLLNGRVPTTPGTRAAAYRLLADLPGFRVMDRGELPDGTVGLARQTRSGWSYAVENGLMDRQVIIDADTGSLRAERFVLREPGTEKLPLPVGTVVHTTTVEQVGWVDADPVLPPGTEVWEPGR